MLMPKYETFVTVTPLDKNELNPSTKDAVLNLTLLLKEALANLQKEKLSDYNYEILSHSMVLLGNQLVTTFLLYHP